MTFAAAYSEHPVAADAAGEVIGRIAEVGGRNPDLILVFASGDHVHFLGEITSAVRSVLQPDVLLGTGAHAVIGEGRESTGAAVSLWASWNGPVRPVRLDVRSSTDPHDDRVELVGLPADIDAHSTLLLVGDAASFPAGSLIDHLAHSRPDVAVVGGLASTGAGSAFVVDDRGYTDGAIGVVIPNEQLVGPVVSQGCRPVGEPMVVTAARGRYLIELANRPALERLEEMVATADDTTRSLLGGGVQVGVAVEERSDTLRAGDFLVRSVLGADRAKGVLALAETVEVGTTVQFHARDASVASDDLHRRLRGVYGDAALVFTCTGRGAQLFGVDDHDALAVVDSVGTETVGGMFCAGEFGPLAGRNHLHSFTASVLVFAAAHGR